MYLGNADGGQLMRASNFRSNRFSVDENTERVILHVDANSFFASCESVLHPEYKTVPMAVCGSVEDRHGIVLAKNALAAKYNIKTAETVWSAKQKCPNLLMVRPTYALYEKMSERLNEIFYEYTDLVESFGLDESWLDVTASQKLFGNGREIADKIRARVRSELGITVSVGVSFNKVFAKLGSDLKKPDATSCIDRKSFASVVWPLPVSALLFVGPSCTRTLNRIGIKTIGDLAVADRDVLLKQLGKNGVMLRDFALGRDFSEVTPMGYEPTPKSVSNGMTFRKNLVTDGEISFAVTHLAMSVAERLRRHNLCCTAVAVTIRTPDQVSISRCEGLTHPTCLYNEISEKALRIISQNHPIGQEIYSVTVHAEKLVPPTECDLQQSFFEMPWEAKYKKIHSLECTVDNIRARYGKKAIGIASAVNNNLIG